MRTLDKAFVADIIIAKKMELFNEDFATWYECNHITNLLEKRLRENKYDVCFSLEIVNDYIFDFFPGIIKRKNIYQYSMNLACEIKDDKLKKLIYDEDFIIGCLYDIQLEKLKSIFKHNCKTCNSMCTSSSKSYCCDRWSHDITIGIKDIIKK